MKLEQGSLVKWTNGDKKEIVWLVLDNKKDGVVIHSDNLVSVGAVNDLSDQDVEPFIGTVHIVSKAT